MFVQDGIMLKKNKLKLTQFGILFTPGIWKYIIPVKYYLYPLTDLLNMPYKCKFFLKFFLVENLKITSTLQFSHFFRSVNWEESLFKQQEKWCLRVERQYVFFHPSTLWYNWNCICGWQLPLQKVSTFVAILISNISHCRVDITVITTETDSVQEVISCSEKQFPTSFGFWP